MVIVAAVDRSDHAKQVVREAEKLAVAFGDTVHALHIMSKGEFVNLGTKAYDEAGTAVPMEEVNALAAEHVKRVVVPLSVEFETVGLVGEASDGVTTYAGRVNGRFIVIGPRKRSPAGKAPFGGNCPIDPLERSVSCFEHYAPNRLMDFPKPFISGWE